MVSRGSLRLKMWGFDMSLKYKDIYNLFVLTNHLFLCSLWSISCSWYLNLETCFSQGINQLEISSQYGKGSFRAFLSIGFYASKFCLKYILKLLKCSSLLKVCFVFLTSADWDNTLPVIAATWQCTGFLLFIIWKQDILLYLHV